MYRNYYSVNDMPQKVMTKERAEKKDFPPPDKDKPMATPKKTGGFGELQTDDIILLAVWAILFSGECDDILLLLAIGFIFLSKD